MPELNEIVLSDPEYSPKNYDPTHIKKLRFLQACERLKIPVPQGPPFDLIQLPPEPMWVQPPAFVPARMNLFNPGRWVRELDKALKQYRNGVVQFHSQLASKTLVRHKTSRAAGPKRRIPPSNLVYEWAVRHRCRKESWASIAKSQKVYTLDQIKKAGNMVLKDLKCGQ